MKKVVTTLILVAFVASSFAQLWRRNRIEVLLGIPTTQYFGDIGGTQDVNNALGFKDISFRSIRPGIVGGITYQYTDKICLNATLTSALWAQTDKGSRNERRNHSFTTFGNELSVSCQYFIIPEKYQGLFHNVTQLRGGLNKMGNQISLYVFAGAGVNIFFVKAADNLLNDPRFTNSQKATLLIPAGVGVKMKVSPQLSLGVELGGRYLFTDKFDGLTTRFSKANDVYYIMSITAQYRILSQNTFKQRRKLRF